MVQIIYLIQHATENIANVCREVMRKKKWCGHVTI